MTWRQFIRSIEADARRRQKAAARAERESMRRYRELVKRERELEKQSEKIRAENEAAQFENYLDLLVSVHKECADPWDWKLLASAAPPDAPVRRENQEAAARAAVESYKPGFFEKLFGGAKTKTAQLHAAVENGRAADEAAHFEAMRNYQEIYAAWKTTREVATHIVEREVSAYASALALTGALDELTAFQTQVALSAAEPDAVVCACKIMDDDLVPREEVKLTASGKLSSKAMAAGRYWTLYQDHVCSAAIRVAREVFAALPVSRVVVNIGPVQVNTKTGHREPVTFLAVHLTRDGLHRLNLSQIDPSDSMKNFPHRMKFKKTTGFELVEAMTLDEQWVTTG